MGVQNMWVGNNMQYGSHDIMQILLEGPANLLLVVLACQGSSWGSLNPSLQGPDTGLLRKQVPKSIQIQSWSPNS